MTPFFVSVKLTVQKLEFFYGNGTLNTEHKDRTFLPSAYALPMFRPRRRREGGAAYMYDQATKKALRGVCLCSSHEEGGKGGGGKGKLVRICPPENPIIAI